MNEFSNNQYLDLNHSKFDTDRFTRIGIPEAVYAPGKTPLQCKEIVENLITLHSICSVVVSTMGFYPTLRGFEPHLRRFFIIFFLSKMRQKVKKSVSILPEGEEKIISFISDFSNVLPLHLKQIPPMI